MAEAVQELVVEMATLEVRWAHATPCLRTLESVTA